MSNVNGFQFLGFDVTVGLHSYQEKTKQIIVHIYATNQKSKPYIISKKGKPYIAHNKSQQRPTPLHTQTHFTEEKWQLLIMLIPPMIV